MIINKAKCGIMDLNLRSKIEGKFKDYPYVKSYRYLGMTFRVNLNSKAHIESIAKKVNYITSRLAALRIRNHANLNINLYKVFIEPLFNQGLVLFVNSNKTSKRNFETFRKVAFKKIITVPRSTPDLIVNKLLGDTNNDYLHRYGIIKEKKKLRK